MDKGEWIKYQDPLEDLYPVKVLKICICGFVGEV